MQKTNFHYFPVLITSLLLVSGCASVGDYHYEYTQKLRAKTQYREAGRPECSKYPRDYKKGWIDGFYEVTTGGSSCPPAIAPECYWKPGQILNDCDNRRHEYYSGWQDGAARASQFPDTHYLKIHETCECPFPRCECGSCGPGGVTCGNSHVAISECNCGGAGTCDTCNPAGMAYHHGVIESDREIIMMPIPDSAAGMQETLGNGEGEPATPEYDNELPAAVATPYYPDMPASPKQPLDTPDAASSSPAGAANPAAVESIEPPAEPRSASSITAEDVKEAEEEESDLGQSASEQPSPDVETDEPELPVPVVTAEVPAEDLSTAPTEPNDDDSQPVLPPATPAVEPPNTPPAIPAPAQEQNAETPVSLLAPTLDTPIARYSFPDDNSLTIEFDHFAPSFPQTSSPVIVPIQKVSAKQSGDAKGPASILSDFDVRLDHDGLIE